MNEYTVHMLCRNLLRITIDNLLLEQSTWKFENSLSLLISNLMKFIDFILTKIQYNNLDSQKSTK